MHAVQVHATFDPEADAAYIYLMPPVPGSAAHSVPCVSENAAGDVILDFDKGGRLIGIEILGASKALPKEILAESVLPGSFAVEPTPSR